MSDISKLREEHADLAAIGAQLSGIIAGDAPPAPQDLYRLRMALASGLIRHLKNEDWNLYPDLMSSSNQRIAFTARAFSASMGGLATEFKDYSERWGADAIRSDWNGYRRDTAEILRSLMFRIAREERDLYPLLETDVQEQSARSSEERRHVHD